MSDAFHARWEPEEIAALYLAGALPPEEVAEFEGHLAAGCGRCAQELNRFDGIIAHLVERHPRAEVSPHVRAALMRRIAGVETEDAPMPNPQVWKQWTSDDAGLDVVIRNATQTGWTETNIEGIQIRRLFVDRDRNQMTAVVRMAPGTAYPGHRHDGPEECLVLEGSLLVGDQRFEAGDYQRMARGSHHGVQATEDGCLLLIISSLTDELT